jgi:hypothetical protein
LNYLGRKPATRIRQSYWGLDATAKWRSARTLSFLLQSEVWVRTLTPSDAPSENTLGAYVFPQYGLSPSVQLGVRGDYFSVLNLKNAGGTSIGNSTAALVPTLTYKASEFSTFRAAYTREWTRQELLSAQTRWLLELQSTFILGAHPAHDF